MRLVLFSIHYQTSYCWTQGLSLGQILKIENFIGLCTYSCIRHQSGPICELDVAPLFMKSS